MIESHRGCHVIREHRAPPPPPPAQLSDHSLNDFRSEVTSGTSCAFVFVKIQEAMRVVVVRVAAYFVEVADRQKLAVALVVAFAMALVMLVAVAVAPGVSVCAWPYVSQCRYCSLTSLALLLQQVICTCQSATHCLEQTHHNHPPTISRRCSFSCQEAERLNLAVGRGIQVCSGVRQSRT